MFIKKLQNKSIFVKNKKTQNYLKRLLLSVDGDTSTRQNFHYSIMDWDSARQHCSERNWNWSLELINQAQKEMEELERKLKKHEDQQKANRLYNSCNY